MDASEDNECTAFLGQGVHMVAWQGISGMDPDSHHIARKNALHIHMSDRFVPKHRITELGRGRSRQNEEPPRGYDGCRTLYR
jgi:hypothetical protein